MLDAGTEQFLASLRRFTAECNAVSAKLQRKCDPLNKDGFYVQWRCGCYAGVQRMYFAESENAATELLAVINTPQAHVDGRKPRASRLIEFRNFKTVKTHR